MQRGVELSSLLIRSCLILVGLFLAATASAQGDSEAAAWDWEKLSQAASLGGVPLGVADCDAAITLCASGREDVDVPQMLEVVFLVTRNANPNKFGATTPESIDKLKQIMTNGAIDLEGRAGAMALLALNLDSTDGGKALEKELWDLYEKKLSSDAKAMFIASLGHATWHKTSHRVERIAGVFRGINEDEGDIRQAAITAVGVAVVEMRCSLVEGISLYSEFLKVEGLKEEERLAIADLMGRWAHIQAMQRSIHELRSPPALPSVAIPAGRASEISEISKASSEQEARKDRERWLKDIVAEMQTIGGIRGIQYNPRAMISVVNKMQARGKADSLAAIKEYLKVDPEVATTSPRDTALLVLRVLFEVPHEHGHAPRLLIGKLIPGAPATREAELALPHYPVLMANDLPLVMTLDYACTGDAAATWHVAYYENHGVLRKRPLRPQDDFESTINHLDRAVKSHDYPDTQEVESMICGQLLRLMDDKVELGQPRKSLITFSQLKAVLRGIELEWNEEEQKYLRSDK